MVVRKDAKVSQFGTQVRKGLPERLRVPDAAEGSHRPGLQGLQGSSVLLVVAQLDWLVRRQRHGHVRGVASDRLLDPHARPFVYLIAAGQYNHTRPPKTR